LVTLSTISLDASKPFLSKHLFNEDGDGLVEPLKGDKLRQMMDKFTTLYSPNIQNLVASYKQRPNNKRYIFSIMSFKANNDYDMFKITLQFK